MRKFDAVVIGSGTGGQTAAHQLTKYGFNWQNIMTPYPSRESDIIYMLESLKT